MSSTPRGGNTPRPSTSFYHKNFHGGEESVRKAPLSRVYLANDERHRRWTHRKALMDAISGMAPLPERPEKLAQAGIMVTKGTLEEALWASAGVNGTHKFLQLKGGKIKSDELADLTPRQGLATRDLQGTSDIDQMMVAMQAKKAGKVHKETKHRHVLDIAFEDWTVKKGIHDALQPDETEIEWKADLSRYLKEYKVRMGKNAKISCSPAELIDCIDELARERYKEVESLVRKRKEDMQRADMFPENVIEQRAEITRRTALWNKVSVQTIKDDLDAKLTKPVKKSEQSQDTEHILFEALGEAKEGVFKYSKTANTTGPKQLIPVREGLAERFDNIYEAWVFLDLDGDWSLSYSEFKNGMAHMRIQNLDMDKIMAFLDKDRNGEIDPFNFVKSLAWHQIPSLQLEVETILRKCARRRKQIVSNAVRRIADVRHGMDAMQGATPRINRRTALRVPLAARTFDVLNPCSPRYPWFEPIKYTRKVENKTTSDMVDDVEQVQNERTKLPQEIIDFHKEREEKHWARRAAARKKNLELQAELKKEDAMLSIECPVRGKLWKLRKGGDKMKIVDWVQVMFVVTHAGDVMHDNEDPKGQPILIGNLKNVVKRQEWKFFLFPVGALELVFRTKDRDGGRVLDYLYMAWGEGEQDDYDRWVDVLKRFTWRCDSINPELVVRPMSDEEQELLRKVEGRLLEEAKKRSARRIYRWYTRARDVNRARAERYRARQEKEQRGLRLEYLKRMSGMGED